MCSGRAMNAKTKMAMAKFNKQGNDRPYFSLLTVAYVSKLVIFLILPSLILGNPRYFNYNKNDIAKILLQVRGGQSSSGFSFRPRPNVINPFKKSNNDHSSSSSSSSTTRFRNDQEEKQNKNDEELESAKEQIDAFLSRDSRNSFIARVYAILSVQLFVTAVSCMLFGLYFPFADLRTVNSLTGKVSPLLWAPLVGVFMSTIAWFRVAVSPNARQKSPNKWWWLTAFTAGEALSIGAISSLYEVRSVVTAMGATALAAVTVSFYTISQQNSKYDLSQWGATLSSWAMILIVYGMLGIAQEVGWLPRGFLPYSDMMYSVFATFLFSLFLAYHTKLIVGGKHAKYRMHEKDYVFGAMALYVDIVNIFLHILQLLGDERK